MNPNDTMLLMAVSFVLGLFLGRAIWRYVPPAKTFPLPGPLPEDEYRSRRQQNNDRYLDSMAKYDKLVPWASGGALVLSATFLKSIVGGASEPTKCFLGASWAFLVLSLLSSLLSQYTSSRIFSWRNRYLEVLQNPPQPSAADEVRHEWEKQARYYDKLASRTYTQRLNELAGISLVIGLLLLLIFTFLNAPFGKEPPTSASPGR